MRDHIAMTSLGSPWIPLAVLLALALGARFYQRNWLAPSVFAPLIWSAFVVIPLIVAPEYKVSGLAVWLIVLLILSIMIGAILGETSVQKVPSGAAVSPLGIKLLLRLTVLFSGLGLAGAIYSAIKAVNDYGLDFSVTGLLAVGHFLAVERYSGEQTPFLVRILVLWIFPAALLGGVSYAVARSRWERLACFFPLFPALLFSVFQAAKANTLIAVVLGLSGYMAMQISLDGKKSHNRLRWTLLVVGSCLFAGLSFFFIVDALRSHTENQENVEVTPDYDRAKSTAVGYLSVFTDWVDSPGGANDLHAGLGAYTFGGLFDAIGLHHRESGLYENSISLSDDEDSNIYTAFRGLIEDYSLGGAVFFCLLLGFASGVAYQKRIVPVLAGTYGFLFWSPIVSLFLYNGPIIALGIGALVCREIKQPKYFPENDILIGKQII